MARIIFCIQGQNCSDHQSAGGHLFRINSALKLQNPIKITNKEMIFSFRQQRIFFCKSLLHITVMCNMSLLYITVMCNMSLLHITVRRLLQFSWSSLQLSQARVGTLGVMCNKLILHITFCRLAKMFNNDTRQWCWGQLLVFLHPSRPRQPQVLVLFGSLGQIQVLLGTYGCRKATQIFGRIFDFTL